MKDLAKLVAAVVIGAIVASTFSGRQAAEAKAPDVCAALAKEPLKRYPNAATQISLAFENAFLEAHPRKDKASALMGEGVRLAARAEAAKLLIELLCPGGAIVVNPPSSP